MMTIRVGLRNKSLFLLALFGCVLAVGTAFASDWAATSTGDDEANDGQDWTFSGGLLYQSWDLSDAVHEHYGWGWTDAAFETLGADTHYVDHPVRYRACILDTSNSELIWESSPQDAMDTRVLEGNSGDDRTWTPDPDYKEPLLTHFLVYKVQSAKDDQSGSIVAEQASLFHNR